MADLTDIQRRHIGLMRTTASTLQNLLMPITQTQAMTLRDGDDGWSVLEILAHLRDFDGFFRQRAQMMLDDDHPALPAYDHEALAIERDYNGQNLAEVLDAFMQSRRETVRFFVRLAEEDWQRTGVHPERGAFSMTDAVIQVPHHDMTHLEQMTRVLVSDSSHINSRK